MCPGRMTSSMPMASVAVIEKSIISSERFREPRKFQSGTFSAKNAVMKSSASPRAESRSERREVICCGEKSARNP